MADREQALVPKHVLLAGVSTRAVAESAARAGFAVTAIDAFLDLDQHPSVRALSPPGPFSAQAAARAAVDLPCDAVSYLANFENDPDAVAVLAAERVPWGNSPAVLERVRDPITLFRAFREGGHPVPAVGGPARTEALAGPWLVKPVASGGGHGVRPWDGYSSVPRGCYLQQFVDGTPGSVVFVAAGGRSVPIGVSRQLIGEHVFGAAGYQYCGNIVAGADDTWFGARIVTAACTLATAVALEFGLVGVNGVDFVARDDVAYPVEVNPRWCASMELVERAYDLSVFAAHAAACDRGVLPEFDLLRAMRRSGAVGKAVVFARQEVTVGDTRAWLEDGSSASIRDVPRPGEHIRAGRPVCSIFAASHDGEACKAALGELAERVYADLAGWGA